MWIGPLGTNFSEILIKIQNFSFMKMPVKILSVKWQPSCLEEMSQCPAPCITRSSAAIVLTMKDREVLDFHEEGYQLYVTYEWQKNNRKDKYIFIFPQIYSVGKWLTHSDSLRLLDATGIGSNDSIIGFLSNWCQAINKTKSDLL